MSDDKSSRARWRWFLPVVIAALLVGALGGYALRVATESPPAPPAPPALPSAQATPTTSAPAPAACVAVSDLAGKMNAQLERAVQAIAALDPGALRAVVDELERLHVQLRPAAEACRAAAAGG